MIRYSQAVRRRAAHLATCEGIAMGNTDEPMWDDDLERVEELRAEVNANGLDWEPDAAEDLVEDNALRGLTTDEECAADGAGAMMTIEEIQAALETADVSHMAFWQHAAGGDMHPMPREDYERCVAEMREERVGTYRITASAEHNGRRIDTSTAEYLGDAFQVEYATEAEARAVAADLQASVAEYSLDPTTRYDVEVAS